MKSGTEKSAFWIRPAGTDDLAAMMRLLQELFTIESEFEFDAVKQRCGLQMLLESASASVWVAERHGRVAGMVTVQMVISTATGGFSGLIEDLVVSQICRRRGLGKALLAAAVKWAREQGATRVQLLADGRNVPALIFYRKQGWKQTNMIALRNFC
ncbi:MAG TPA: GNAT family N-acetyltransferase [Pontiellaceae bacterium]|nr:GNAT family N-acetyltransferase [Pontiellaceae bacterium]HPR82550.1 GNAT family N-acetyltransferase [Pontiellaceae bacterium]